MGDVHRTASNPGRVLVTGEELVVEGGRGGDGLLGLVVRGLGE